MSRGCLSGRDAYVTDLKRGVVRIFEGQVRRFAAPLCCCHLAEQRSKNWRERFQELLSCREIRWRWCHARMGWCQVSWEATTRPWMSAFTMQGSNQRGVRRAGQEGLQTRCDSESVSPPARACSRPPNSHRVPACLAALPSKLLPLSSDCP